ncbi:type II secretion system major pseudopilin GspG [Acuticoccus yangtzensis]|uniref:type II secretion system major pseudopilin GspG n=1 Tax=Acuticoccus yangtzensis TaxID=1443441 RepID=UPI000949B0E3|nr:type II secretion system major pseudopilin GspG [Acuticoccus yangtzensis]
MNPSRLRTRIPTPCRSLARPAGRAPRRDRSAGFTLVELLVVLVILALVMGLVAPRVLGYLSSSRERAAALQIQSLGAALDLYFIDVGRYPSAAEGLGALVQRPGGLARWNGPYLQQNTVPLDPWGNAYAYAAEGPQSYTIVSHGPDGRASGGDDIAPR